MGEPEPQTSAAEHGREIRAVARLTPERRAIASEHGDLTFAELDRDAERLAGFLQNAGLSAGDVVALLCTNRPEWIVSQQAALRSGFRLVPVNWHLKGDDIDYVIADSGAQALITEDKFIGELGVGELGVGELGVGELSVGELSVGELSVGELSVGELSVGELSVGELSVGELSVGELGVGELGVGELGVGELGVGELGVGELGVGELGVGELGVGELGVGELGVGELSVGELGVGELGVGELGVGELGVGELGVGELGVGELGVGELSDGVRDIKTRIVIGNDVEGFTSFAEALSQPLPTDPQRLRGSLMIYTSGSTGRPKGVRQAEGSTSSGAAIGAAMVAMFGLDGDRGDQMLCPAPLYHSGPSRICSEWPLGAGVTVHLMARFDPEAALELIDTQRLTHAFFVPTMFHRMLEVDDRARYDLSSLRFVLHGAGPCNAAIKAQMFDWLGPIIHEMYAATEGPGTWIQPQEWLEHPGSVGRTDPTRLQIRLDDGEAAEPLQDGTVWSRATTPFHYHDDPDKTAATFDASGEWYTVGDRGHIDDDGYLYLTGRTAECIVSGGVNLYPARVDEALLGHRGVRDGAAFALDDVELGQVMAAAIIPSDNTPSDYLIESVITHCRETIGSQLTPRHVFIVDELPRTEAGKLYRHRLTEQFCP